MPDQTLLLRTADLIGKRPRHFALAPDATARAALAAELGLLGIEALRLEGEVRPAGRDDLVLEARLQARVVQPCIVTLAPVSTAIDERVRRRYLSDAPAPAPGETEMTGDDGEDPMPDRLDLGEVMAEALVLALPDYPRAGDEELGSLSAAPPGAAPIEETPRRNPFAGLAAALGQSEDGDAAGGAEDGTVPMAKEGPGTGETG